MADNKVGAPALDTNIESGQFDEKSRQAPAENAPKKVPAVDDDDEDEDIDALIEDLESQDGHDAFEEEEEEGAPGGGRVVPEEMLQTDSRVGLTESEVTARRRKYGLNQMKEEKENLVLKFLSYFIGPIQFVMEVSFDPSLCALFSAVLVHLPLSRFYRINIFHFPRPVSPTLRVANGVVRFLARSRSCLRDPLRNGCKDADRDASLIPSPSCTRLAIGARCKSGCQFLAVRLQPRKSAPMAIVFRPLCILFARHFFLLACVSANCVLHTSCVDRKQLAPHTGRIQLDAEWSTSKMGD